MKNKIIKIFILMSILLLSFTRGDSHFMSMSDTNVALNNTISHCSDSDMAQQKNMNDMKKSHNFCEFVCTLVFLHSSDIHSDIFISYKDLFYFHSSFYSLQLTEIFKPPIYS